MRYSYLRLNPISSMSLMYFVRPRSSESVVCELLSAKIGCSVAFKCHHKKRNITEFELKGTSTSKKCSLFMDDEVAKKYGCTRENGYNTVQIERHC